jgi:hypothetical protein
MRQAWRRFRGTLACPRRDLHLTVTKGSHCTPGDETGWSGLHSRCLSPANGTGTCRAVRYHRKNGPRIPVGIPRRGLAGSEREAAARHHKHRHPAESWMPSGEPGRISTRRRGQNRRALSPYPGGSVKSGKGLFDEKSDFVRNRWSRSRCDESLEAKPCRLAPRARGNERWTPCLKPL